MTTGKLIVFEGIDGAGKTEQLNRLYRRLIRAHASVVRTAEPCGTELGRYVQNFQQNPWHKTEPLAELLLFMAARAQHVEGCLNPWLENGFLVLCDRFTASTVAYQGYGQGLDLRLIKDLDHTATGGLFPDLTIWIDVPVAVAADRVARRDGSEFDPELMERVRHGYQQYAIGRQAVKVDGTQPVDKVEAVVWAAVSARLGLDG